MNLPPPQSLKPFGATRPRAAGPLVPSAPGAAGRYAAQPPTQHDQIVDQTRTWVAQTFFGTLLKQMRDSPFKSDLFSGGSGGQAFAGLQDQQLAERMARGTGSKLVNGIVRRIEANAAYRKQSLDEGGRGDNRRPDESRNRDPRARRDHVAPARRP